MASSPFDLFKRKPKHSDPFGSDDDLWGPDPDDSESYPTGPKVAVIVSAVFFLLFIGALGTGYMMLDESAGNVGGTINMAELQSSQPAEGEDGDTSGDLETALSSEETSAPPRPSSSGAARGRLSGAPEREAGETESRATNRIGLPTGDPDVIKDETAATTRDVRRRPWLAGGSENPTIELDVEAPEAAPVEDVTRVGNRTLQPITEEELYPERQSAEPESRGPLPGAEPLESDRLARLAQESRTAFGETGQDVYDTEAPSIRRMLPPGTPGMRQAQVQNSDGRPILIEPDYPPRRPGVAVTPPPRYNTLPDAPDVRYAPGDQRKPIVIIISNLGVDREATIAAIEKLPADVTLGFSPYAVNLKSWLERAQTAGHEVLVEVATEGRTFPADDPGPLGLFTTLEVNENRQRLQAILERAVGASGVIDPMGGEFRRIPGQFNPIQVDLERAGLFYVQGRPGPTEGRFRLPHTAADTIIDERPFRAAIDARLSFLEKLADYQGSAVGVADALPVTFERILIWAEDLRQRGYVLAPASAVLKQANS